MYMSVMNHMSQLKMITNFTSLLFPALHKELQRPHIQWARWSDFTAVYMYMSMMSLYALVHTSTSNTGHPTLPY